MTHPYERIAEAIRHKIHDGEDGYGPGERLPSIKELSHEWGVATATVRNALSWLQVEGFIRTSPRGTFVADNPPTASSALDRLERCRRTGSILGYGEWQRVTVAELTIPPVYVAELFDLVPGDQVIRREFAVGRRHERILFGVHWYPAHFAVHVPDLLSIAPKKGGDMLPKIEESMDRTVKYGRDAMHAREATEREANHLGLKTGAPILAHVHEWSDDLGILEYGEWCLPPLRTVGYEYRP